MTNGSCRVRTLAGLSAVLFLLVACGPSDDNEEVVSIVSGRVEEGRRLSEEACAVCHAIKGDYAVTPATGAPSFTIIADNPTYTELGLTVFLNSHHDRMPNYVLSAQDQADVIAYIHSLRPPKVEAN